MSVIPTNRVRELVDNAGALMGEIELALSDKS